MSYTDPTLAPGTAALLAAGRRLLRPLVGLMIRRGITYPVLADLLRGLYVDIAERDLLADPKSRSDSRISLMTGVHRKEIRRLRDQTDSSPSEPGAVTIGSQVIARWLALAGADGPPALPRATFEQLVEAITTDIRPRVVLDEFLARGLIEIDPDDRAHLRQAAYLPAPGADAQAFFLGRNLHDHMAAAAANVLAADAAPFLDRAAHYDRLSPETALLIEAEARVIAQRALERINAFAMAAIAASEQTGTPAGGTGRVNLGVYVYRDETPA